MGKMRNPADFEGFPLYLLMTFKNGSIEVCTSKNKADINFWLESMHRLKFDRKDYVIFYITGAAHPNSPVDPTKETYKTKTLRVRSDAPAGNSYLFLIFESGDISAEYCFTQSVMEKRAWELRGTSKVMSKDFVVFVVTRLLSVDLQIKATVTGDYSIV